MKARLLLALLFILTAFSQAAVQYQSQKIDVSGAQIQVTNNLQTTIAAFGISISSPLPATISVVTQGCVVSGTCTTIDTYTIVASTSRTPTIGVVYDYFTVSATWTGGTNVKVTISSTLTSSASSGTIAPGTFTTVQSGTYNATGAPPYQVAGVAANCANLLSDCSLLEQINLPANPISKNFLTANNGNSIQLLAQQGSLSAITGLGTSTIQSVYTVVIPQNLPGAGKCLKAEVAFIHTGANSVTYNWSFVAHSGALAASGTSIAQTSALAASDEITICNGAGVQNAQTLNQKPAYFGGSGAPGGVTTTAIDITAAGGADLSFTFNTGTFTDTVTPKFIMVTLIL